MGSKEFDTGERWGVSLIKTTITKTQTCNVDHLMQGSILY